MMNTIMSTNSDDTFQWSVEYRMGFFTVKTCLLVVEKQVFGSEGWQKSFLKRSRCLCGWPALFVVKEPNLASCHLLLLCDLPGFIARFVTYFRVAEEVQICLYIWSLVPYSLIWSVCLGRNELIFMQTKI